MQYLKPQIQTICLGQAASMGAILLASGASGKRYALPNSRIMIHQLQGGFSGQAEDIDIQTKEMVRLKDAVNSILASHTGRKMEEIEQDTKEIIISLVKKQNYGLIDVVMKHRDQEVTSE